MAKDKLRVDSLNRYLYVVNNPVNLVDPSGLEFSPKKALDSAWELLKEGYSQYKDVKNGVSDGVGKYAVVGVLGVLKTPSIINAGIGAISGNDFYETLENDKIYQGVDYCEKGICSKIDEKGIKNTEYPELYKKGEKAGYTGGVVATLIYMVGIVQFLV